VSGEWPPSSWQAARLPKSIPDSGWTADRPRRADNVLAQGRSRHLPGPYQTGKRARHPYRRLPQDALCRQRSCTPCRRPTNSGSRLIAGARKRQTPPRPAQSNLPDAARSGEVTAGTLQGSGAVRSRHRPYVGSSPTANPPGPLSANRARTNRELWLLVGMTFHRQPH